jgi:hypothetical protein
MANQLSGQTGATPRTYQAHTRYARFARVRYANQTPAYLALIATKLTSTAAVIFAKIKKYGYARVNAATNLSQLP